MQTLKDYLDAELRERCRPTREEIAEKQKDYARTRNWIEEQAAIYLLETWIEEETDRRVAEDCYSAGMPKLKRRVA